MFQREVCLIIKLIKKYEIYLGFFLGIQLQQAREKLDSSRLESLTDSEETISELRKRHEREKKILVDDNRKMMAELEMLSENNRRLQGERLQMDNDYEELR